MKVILLERVDNLGSIGDQVTVKDGFARNYLLPRSKALRATASNVKLFEAQKEAIQARNLAAKSEAEKQASEIDGHIYVMIRQAGETGQLYGSVSARDISEAIAAEGHKAERNQIVLNTPIKTLGLHKLKVRLHAEVSAMIAINIARSIDEADRQASGENVIDTQMAEDRAQAEETAADMLEGGAGSMADTEY
jgi:large subunit ribosomal protein L9